MKTHKSWFLKGRIISESPVPAHSPVVQIVNNHFQACNAARLREACQLFTSKMLQRDVTIGMSLTGALTPAGLGGSCVVPLVESGWVDRVLPASGITVHR